MNESKIGELRLPIVRIAPFLAAGMTAAYFGSGGFGVFFIAAAAAVLIFAAIKQKLLILPAASAIIGFILMSLYVIFYCQPIMSYSGKTVIGEVRVNEILSADESGLEFVGTINLGGLSANVRFSGDNYVDEGWTALVEANLEAPDEEYLLRNLSKGILLSGEITEYRSIVPGNTGLAGFFGIIRQSLSEKLCENLSGENAELAMAMLFGEDENLSPALSEYIKISGAAHYTAVSGAHFSVLAAVVLSTISSKRRKLKTVISLATAPAALLFFGFSPSVLRASLMFLLYSLAMLVFRKANTLNSLCLAVTAMLIINPATVLDIGFVMSVLGVLGAGVAGTEIGDRICEDLLPEKAQPVFPLVRVTVVSLCAVICTAPVSAAVFHGISLSGILVSILLIPLITICMMFTLLLGITQMTFLAVPINLSLSLVRIIVEFFGKNRGMWLTLDYEYAWIPPAVCAVLLIAGVYLRREMLKYIGGASAFLVLFSLSMPLYVSGNRSEIRFVGNYYTNAAVVIQHNEAAVFVSGNGVGLAESISRCMREHGAVKITCLAAFEADFSGAMAISELSDICPVDVVYTNSFAKALLPKLNVEEAVGQTLSVSGITLASAKVTDSETSADIVLYHGIGSDIPDNKAGKAVYFFSSDKKLPENGVNARQNKDYCIKMNLPEAVIRPGS